MNTKDNADEIKVSSIVGLSASSKEKLFSMGYKTLADFKDVYFPLMYESISFDQSKVLLKVLVSNGVSFKFAQPEWDEQEWNNFVSDMVTNKIVTWKEIAFAVCGELNPPQVGTAIASNKSFQKKFPPRQTMTNVMSWFYDQKGVCANCGTRLFLEADHIRPKQSFSESGLDPEEADTLNNLQLLCKRCNVIKRPSHDLGGISFAPAQSVLIWILLHHKPESKQEFYKLCREHGLTMANIRFDEAWAFAEWLKREGRY